MLWESAAVGVAVAAVNGVVAWWTIQWSWKRSPTFFVQAFLCGMVLRLIAIGVILAAIFSFTPLQKAPFTAALVVVFLVLQVLEIVTVIRKRDAERAREQALPPEWDRAN